MVKVYDGRGGRSETTEVLDAILNDEHVTVRESNKKNQRIEIGE